MQRGRMSGVLLHLSSLPSPYGIGDMGPGSRRFVEFLERSGQQLWQILPLNPAGPDSGNSPYHSYSVFAGNPLFISPDILVRDGFLKQGEACRPPGLPAEEVHYPEAISCKEEMLSRAFNRFEGNETSDFDVFCGSNSYWLDDYALFAVAKKKFEGKKWRDWPEEVRVRRPSALLRLSSQLGKEIRRTKFHQYLFFRQWEELRSFCRDRHVRIVGDLPIYPTYDSVDLWVNGSLFKLAEDGSPLTVAGVPPDYFSATGQLWGNPVYDWDALEEADFSWWVRRMEHNLGLFDSLRLDHFRGLVAFWEVPAEAETSVNGTWSAVPKEKLFRAIFRSVSPRALIAEDLGTITPDVTRFRRRLGLPGMKVLLFAFGDDLATNPYLPHNYGENCVVYTGTHDNNTVRGWFERESRQGDRERLCRYLGRAVEAGGAHRELVRLAMGSVARMAILPMQDLLGLGAEARMNRPAVIDGNWKWRLEPGQVSPHIEESLQEMTDIYGRLRR